MPIAKIARELRMTTEQALQVRKSMRAKLAAIAEHGRRLSLNG
jgi:hypothetical protein